MLAATDDLEKQDSDIAANVEPEFKKNSGYCSVCESQTWFVEFSENLRDCYLCANCHSIPRQRALLGALHRFVPEWKNLKIHESSPDGVSSELMEKQCPQYTATQFFQDVSPGESKGGIRCENLECMTFSDQSFDLMITQDVFEHVMHPSEAFKEIARTLKPGGLHVFTMPWYPHLKKSVQRVRMVEGQVEILQEPIYHGNPVDENGSLVTFDWGLDFLDFIYQHSGMFTTTYLVKDRSLGLEGELLEVFISRKSA
jgi:SAM-dependent methyltransferase